METTERKMSLRDRSLESVDSLIFAYVRIALGVAVFLWASSYTKIVQLNDEWIPLYEAIFLRPRFLFKYPGFEWVQLWPGNGIYWHFTVTKIAAFCFAIGFLTRISAILMSIGTGYVLLVECQIYVNHYYLMSCLSAMMAFLPAARRLSIDAWLGLERHAAFAPAWQLWLLRFQLGIPYVFGAVAKMNSDWLRGQPAEIWLTNWIPIKPAVATFMEIPGAPLLFSYGGLLYDLCVVPLLLNRKTRLIGVAASLGFHLTNSQLFSIGVFPWMMLATLVVFFDRDTLPKFFRFVSSKYTDHPIPYRQAVTEIESQRINQSGQASKKQPLISRIGLGMAITYIVIQLILPVRPWIYPGNPSWNERGHRFAWRMMLRHKVTLTTFLVVAPDGSFQYYPSSVVMTGNQARRAEGVPDLLRQASVELKKLAAEAGASDSKVYCLSLVSLNGRRPIPIVDPTADLASVKRGWWSDDWVMDDIGPLPSKPWSSDVNQWWVQLVLPKPFKPLQGRKPKELQDLMDQQRARSELENK